MLKQNLQADQNQDDAACRRDAVAGGMSLEDAMQKWQTLDQLPAQYRAN